ncbi:MAG: hypothetical protein E6J74_35035, partial [Deltaproteobacteria bacterium]
MRSRKPNRLSTYNYAQPGAYFITTVVNRRQSTFGEIKDGTIQLTPYGEIVVKQWHWLHKRYLQIILDEFVAMPNHFHGIINIRVGTGRDLSLQSATTDRPKVKTLSELIGAFKTTTSKLIHQAGMTSFQWQRSFYERIVRNEDELFRIREYIQTNPLRWDSDVENVKR